MYEISLSETTPVAMLTVGQLKSVLTPLMSGAPEQTNTRHYVYGLRGIAKIFNCSIPTAMRLKSSGKIDGAIVQTGRKIITDSALALELAGRK